MTRFVNFWNEEPEMTSHALKLLMKLPSLLLQRTTNVKITKYRNKVHKYHLERPFNLWKNGQVKELLNESQTL